MSTQTNSDSSSSPEYSTYEEAFEVEKIIKHRVDEESGEIYYYVKWIGYDYDDCTWEPLNHLKNCKAAIEDYEKTLEEQSEEEDSLSTIFELQKDPLSVVVVREEDLEQRFPSSSMFGYKNYNCTKYRNPKQYVKVRKAEDNTLDVIIRIDKFNGYLYDFHSVSMYTPYTLVDFITKNPPQRQEPIYID